MKKVDRQMIFNKYAGHCAYCGCELPERWHIDHIKPVRRNLFDGTMKHPENDVEENLMPSCPSCNINKHSLSLEEFRKLISGFINSLNRDSTQYKIAKRYGLVEEIDKPVVFYFETIRADMIL